jgi:hypothetical protein
MSPQTARQRLWLLALYAAGVVVATMQRGVWSREHTTFSIFRQSFTHLVTHHNLYAAYPAEQGAAAVDLFKYSPSAAVLFAPLAMLPFAAALLLWNFANAGLLVFALTRTLSPARANLALLLLAPEVFVAIQSSSSNGLVTALILLAAAAYENGRLVRAGYALVVGASIKVFPLAGFIFALLQARRRHAVIGAGLAFAAVLALPLLVVSPSELLQQYRWWGELQGRDARDMVFGLSLMRQLRDWAGIGWPNWVMQVAGTTLFLLPLLLRQADWRCPRFRLQYLCSLLVFVVLFNHQAERQSFIIAATGCAIWLVSSPPSLDRLVLMALALAGVPTVPYLVLWLVMQAELLRGAASVTLDTQGEQQGQNEEELALVADEGRSLRRRWSGRYRRAS